MAYTTSGKLFKNEVGSPWWIRLEPFRCKHKHLMVQGWPEYELPQDACNASESLSRRLREHCRMHSALRRRSARLLSILALGVNAGRWADFGGDLVACPLPGKRVPSIPPHCAPYDNPARAVMPDELNGDSACATLVSTRQMRSRHDRSE